MCVNGRRERRSDVYVAACTTQTRSRGSVMDGYSKAEHNAALDRLLADLAEVKPAGRNAGDHSGSTQPKLRLVGTGTPGRNQGDLGSAIAQAM